MFAVVVTVIQVIKLLEFPQPFVCFTESLPTLIFPEVNGNMLFRAAERANYGHDMIMTFCAAIHSLNPYDCTVEVEYSATHD